MVNSVIASDLSEYMYYFNHCFNRSRITNLLKNLFSCIRSSICSTDWGDPVLYYARASHNCEFQTAADLYMHPFLILLSVRLNVGQNEMLMSQHSHPRVCSCLMPSAAWTGSWSTVLPTRRKRLLKSVIHSHRITITCIIRIHHGII